MQTKELEIPKSEQTLKRNKYTYKGLQFKNDLGWPCLYRIEKNGVDTKSRAQYSGGRLLQVLTLA